MLFKLSVPLVTELTTLAVRLSLSASVSLASTPGPGTVRDELIVRLKLSFTDTGARFVEIVIPTVTVEEFETPSVAR